MKVITLLNEKGGVAKTTLAVHLAQGLACGGQRVMLIDADPQGHSTMRCGLQKAPGFYDLMVREAEWQSVSHVVPPEKYGVPGERLPQGTLWVVRGNVETRNIANSISDSLQFADRLEELRDGGSVDVVVIDTSPTPSLLHGAIYTATDYVVYPTKLTLTAFDGLAESIRHRMSADNMREARWGIKPIEVMGIVPVEYRAVTLEQQENLEELRKQFERLVWEPIAQRTVWTESEGRALPVWSIEPYGDAAMDAWRFVDAVKERLYVAV